MSDYRRGIEDAIAVLMDRGTRIRGAVQPDYTAREIRARLLPDSGTYFDGETVRDKITKRPVRA